ncbi:hypothetical protein CDAR_186431 [Caerostris darwini]|uniref:Uncharacterized protein n=1 Tax=Caerostris darwini TaxID=1538125 RepID=A0AAV4V1U0_9ARAC|nr:hypothetical protein CDAR_186431 [Caerostris darwini]
MQKRLHWVTCFLRSPFVIRTRGHFGPGNGTDIVPENHPFPRCAKQWGRRTPDNFSGSFETAWKKPPGLVLKWWFSCDYLSFPISFPKSSLLSRNFTITRIDIRSTVLNERAESTNTECIHQDPLQPSPEKNCRFICMSRASKYSAVT